MGKKKGKPKKAKKLAPLPSLDDLTRLKQQIEEAAVNGGYPLMPVRSLCYRIALHLDHLIGWTKLESLKKGDSIVLEYRIADAKTGAVAAGAHLIPNVTGVRAWKTTKRSYTKKAKR